MNTDNRNNNQTETIDAGQSDFFKALMANPIVGNLPKHLKQFIVDQNYVAYSPVDHSVWRYVLRQNYRFLIDHAHEIYFEGLEKTGLKVEGVPSIQEMNEILHKIGWAAVSVDGFIPPAAFMEFQAHRVLVIAADMRQIQHIEYTPSPDIIHEAAGHAPVIADPEYADYLRRFGEVGARAMSSKKDYQLYEAIRKLSILKEARDADKNEIDEAEKLVVDLQNNLGKPSEMALLSRLHWWTVEYGLIGELDKPKIYGAGLLSSIGEAANCLSPKIKKIPYDINAANYPFDITTMQPHLFVTPDFGHLIDVLEQFADKMAFRVGGLEGLNKAIECENTSTFVYSSGIMVSGTVSEALTLDNNPIYIKTSGITNLSYDYKELPNHGIDYHADGFGSPVGLLEGADKPLEHFSDADLSKHKIKIGENCKLTFESGIVVEGTLKDMLMRDDKIILLSFDNCRVTYKDQLLFDPSWGVYDMAVGATIESVFSGAADKDAYNQPSTVSKMRVIKYSYDEKMRKLHQLYQQLRDYRAGELDQIDLAGIWATVSDEYSDEWLIMVELLELIVAEKTDSKIEDEIKARLKNLSSKNSDLTKLIEDGIYLAYNPNQYQHTWKE